MNFKVLSLICMMVFSGCSKPLEEVPDNVDPIKLSHTTKSEFSGSVVKSDENSPNAFFNMLVNERSQFQEKGTFLHDHTFEQLIFNDDNTLVVKALWRKKDEDWRCYSVSITFTNKIDSDSMQVFFRFPYRFEQATSIANFINDHFNNNSLTSKKLPDGAVIVGSLNGDKRTYTIN